MGRTAPLTATTERFMKSERQPTRKFREVPLHSQLIEQGLLDYAKSRGARPLFYDPRSSRGGKWILSAIQQT